MIWNLDHVVWAIALALTPASAPEPVEPAPVVVTSSAVEVAADPEVEAAIALHTETLKNAHSLFQAVQLGLYATGHTDLARSRIVDDIRNVGWWQAEWAATGIDNPDIEAEYVAVIGLFEDLLDQWVPVTADQSGVDDYKPVGADDEA